MKYLKTFESKSVEKFEHISEDEWVDLIKLSIDFPENQIEEIQSLFTETIRKCKVYYSPHPYLYLSATNWHFEMNCLPDEWYLVRSGGSGSIYKCDQFDGLLDCLEFLKIKKIYPKTK